MITILHTCIREPLPEHRYGHYLRQLPESLREQNVRYRRWEDRHAHLFGKMLLLEGLRPYGFDAGCLRQLQYNRYNRPFLPAAVDFNLSHSGNYVVAAFAGDRRVGIDVEQIAPVALEDFTRTMTPPQWQEIRRSENPLRTFFTYWTIKESVIKADSRGLSLPLDEIHISGDTVSCAGRHWYIRLISFDPDYSVCLASDGPDIEYTVRCHTFS